MVEIDVTRAQILIASSLIFFILTLPANSASFDCQKATTQAELTICSSEHLSHLDDMIGEQWQLLDRSSRYFPEIQAEQLKWIDSEERFSDGVSFETQLEYLRFMNAMNNCLFTEYGTTNYFRDCADSVRANEVSACETTDNQSTLSIGICRSAHLKALRTIEAVETELSNSQNSNLWNEYRDSECEWMAAQWQGSISGTIFVTCHIDLTIQRISNIFTESR
ncbi:hypothetical protein [Roseobacter sp. HKCCA0882]|uniref:hypothetical protein n=1 Tax=Roseobacter sp. HKCCA0882 TaxID=3120337 RepID=UPI0030EB55C5